MYDVDPGSLYLLDDNGVDAPDKEEKDAVEELNESISYLVRNYSPRLDSEITEKICAAYPTWSRKQGRIPVDANDPAEIAIAALTFISLFLLLIILFRKRHN